MLTDFQKIMMKEEEEDATNSGAKEEGRAAYKDKER